MLRFFENNWLSILSILIGIAVAYIFYRLQKKDGTSASMERKKHARSELLDVIESYIINKQNLTEHIIENLMHASERDHLVVLRPEYTTVSLLQDVALRLQRSRHLDIPQKSEYSEKIERLIVQIRGSRNSAQLVGLENEIANAVLELQQLVSAESQQRAQELVSIITSLAQHSRNDANKVNEVKARLLALTTAMLGVAAAAATFLIGLRGTGSVSSPVVSKTVSQLFPLLGLLLAVVVALQVIATTVRIKRRSRAEVKRNVVS